MLVGLIRRQTKQSLAEEISPSLAKTDRKSNIHLNMGTKKGLALLARFEIAAENAKFSHP